MFRRFKSKADMNRPYSADALNVITAFAKGDETLRETAIAKHRIVMLLRKELSNHPASRFMAEIDTPVPDLNLRALARKDLLVLGA